MTDRNIVVTDILNDDDNEDEEEINGWTKRNMNIIQKWKRQASRLIFIYDSILEKYKIYYAIITILTLIFSSISTLLLAVLTALQTMDATQYIYPMFWITIIALIISMFMTILQGIKSITKWDNFIITLIKFIEKMDVFYVNVTSQLNVPVEYRIDGNAFVRMANNEYQYVIIQTPDTFTFDLIKGNKKYEKFLKNREIYKKSSIYNDYESIV